VRHDADELGLRALALPQPLVLRLELAPACFEALSHPVEGIRQLLDLAKPLGLEPRRKVPAGEARSAFRDLPHRPSDRPGEIEAEPGHEQGGRDQAGDGGSNRLVGATLRGRRPGRRERVLG
jgi:hypothetical protein